VTKGRLGLVWVRLRHSGDVCSMSGLPPKAAVERTSTDVSNVPEAAVSNRSKPTLYSITSSAGASSGGGTFELLKAA
jgi:hypothetical protein